MKGTCLIAFIVGKISFLLSKNTKNEPDVMVPE